MPEQKTLDVWKGNTTSINLYFRTRENGAVVPLDLTGSEIVFVAKWGSQTVRISSMSGPQWALPDANAGHAVLNLSVSDAAVFPLGSVVKFEVIRKFGDTIQTWLYGHLKVSEWSPE